jgi:tape measure domain-containing protein
MTKFLETARFIKELNALWDEHAAHIATANAGLSSTLKTASRIPSEYLENLKKISSLQDKISKSTVKLAQTSETAYEKMRLSEIKLQLAREKSFDKYDIKLKRETAAKEKELAKYLNSNEAKINSEQKLTAERDKAFSKFQSIQKESIALEERKQTVMNKPYNSAKELDKISAKQDLLKLKSNQAAEALMALDKALHKVGSSSSLPGASTRINVSNVNAKQAAAAAKEQERLAREAARANDALARQAAIAARMAEPYNRLKAAHTAAEKTLRNLIASETASNREIRAAQKEFDILSQKIQRADNAVGRLSSHQQSLGKLSRGIGSLMGAFGISTGLYLGANIIKDIYSTSKELQSLDLALSMVSGSVKEFNDNSQFIQSVANKWGLEIKSLTQTYTQFYTASKGLLSNEDIKTTFEGIAKAGSIMGLSLEKQQSAFYAFDQMMSKGTVTAEELKKQLGNAMPGAIKAAAMAYMDLHPQIKTIQEAEKELYAQMKKGAIDSATYVPLIVKNFQKLYGIEALEQVDTMQAAQNRLSNSWTELVRSMNESKSGGLSVFLNAMIGGLSNGLNLLVRFNTEWNTLFKKSRAKGQEVGSDFYNVNVSREKLEADRITLMKEAERLARMINITKGKLDKEGFFSEINPFLNRGNDIEKSMGELGQLEGAIRKINNALNPKAKKAVAAGVTEETEAQAAKRIAKSIADAKRQAKEIEELNKERYQLELSNLNTQKYELEELSKLKQNSYSENIALAFKIGLKEQEIAKLVHDEEVRLAGSSKEKKQIADNEYYIKKLELAKDYIKRIEAVEFKPQYKDKNKVADEETYGSGVFETSESTLGTMTDMWKKQQDEKDKVAKQEEDRMRNLRQVYNDIFSEFGKATGFEKSMDMFAKVGRNGKTFWENLIGGKDGQMELKDGLLAGLTITQDVGNKIAEASERRFSKLSDTLEAQKEAALVFAGDSSAAKLRIEEEYNAKSKELAKKQAIAKKKQAMFNIAMDLAQALISLWVNPGFPAAIPMSIAVGALGAIQLGVAAATPLPSYYVGTNNAKEGYANTDERGAELHLDKNNRIKDFGSNKGARVKYLSEGDKIIPASKTSDILKGVDFSSLDDILSLNNILYSDNKNNQLDTTGIISSIQTLNQTILNKEVSEEHYDERGWIKFKKLNGQKLEEKNNRIRFKKSVL